MQVNLFLNNAIISTVLLFLFATGVGAEPYISREFPPNEVVLKAIRKSNVKILGKTGQDNEFTVYYQWGNKVDTLPLVRLDTNMWVYLDAGFRILEK